MTGSTDALGAGWPVDVKPDDGHEEPDFNGFAAAALVPVGQESLDPKTLAMQLNLDQRYSEQAVITGLAEEQFSGRLYGRFEYELMKYGLNVVAGMVKSGKIWGHCKKAGFGLPLTERDRVALEADQWQAAHDLAVSTIGVTLPKFRQLALVEGRWTPAGGATVSTYFIGLTAYTFPNEYRHWRTTITEPLYLVEELPDVEHVGADPATIVDLDARLIGGMCAFEPTVGQIICLTDMGYEQKDIADELGLTSARAVEGRLRRTRIDPDTRRKVKDHA